MPNNTKRNNLKRKENDMGQMSWLSYLIETQDEKGLIEFLAGKGFRKPKYAAEQFFKAQKEIEQDNKKRKEEK